MHLILIKPVIQLAATFLMWPYSNVSLEGDLSHVWLYMYMYLYYTINLIGGVMVSMLTSSAVDHEFNPDHVKLNTIKLVFVASQLRWARNIKERAKFQWVSTIKQH